MVLSKKDRSRGILARTEGGFLIDFFLVPIHQKCLSIPWIADGCPAQENRTRRNHNPGTVSIEGIARVMLAKVYCNEHSRCKESMNLG